MRCSVKPQAFFALVAKRSIADAGRSISDRSNIRCRNARGSAAHHCAIWPGPRPAIAFERCRALCRVVLCSAMRQCTPRATELRDKHAEPGRHRTPAPDRTSGCRTCATSSTMPTASASSRASTAPTGTSRSACWRKSSRIPIRAVRRRCCSTASRAIRPACASCPACTIPAGGSRSRSAFPTATIRPRS